MRLTERIEQRMESESGKGATKILAIAFGAVTTVLLGLLNVNVRDSNAIASKALAVSQEAEKANNRQDADRALMRQRMDGMQKVSDATVASLQALTQSVLNNHDDIIRLQQADASRLQHQRPGH